MKKITSLFKRALVVILVLSASASLFGQDIQSSKLTWTVGSGKDLRDNKAFNITCVFETDGTGIKWIQDNGSFTTSFSILSTEGTWGDVSKRGKITYQVRDEGGDGTLIFERTSSGARITLKIAGDNAAGAQYQFSVNQVTVGN